MLFAPFVGLWRADGSPKPAVDEISRRRGMTCVAPPSGDGWSDIEPATFAADRRAQLVRLYERYRLGASSG